MNEEHNPTKRRLIILSDLWGKEKSNWITHYLTELENYFEVKYYDVCDLGNVDKTEYTAEKLHEQFIAGGVERAVEKILQKEKDFITILGFSIGGSIGWKASLAGAKAEHLFAVSSTRLRYETQKPKGSIELFYGENEAYKPEKDWFDTLQIKENLYKNEGHELYQKKEIAADICRLVIEKVYQQ